MSIPTRPPSSMQNSRARPGFGRSAKTANIGAARHHAAGADRAAGRCEFASRAGARSARSLDELSRSWRPAATSMRAGVSAARIAGGDAVSLLMSNCAEYLAVWLGLDAHRRGRCARQFAACRRGARAFDQHRRIPSYLIVGADLAPRVARDPRAPAGGDVGAAVCGIQPRFRAARAGT